MTCSEIEMGAAEPLSAEQRAPLCERFDLRGILLVRGAIAPDVLAKVRAAAEAIYAEREIMSARGALPEELAVDYVRRFIRLDDLALDVQTEDALFPPLFREIAAHHLGDHWQLGTQNYVRSILAARTDTYLPFHQDESILKRKLLNMWIPLDDCGSDAPGLELVVGGRGELLPLAPPPDPRFAVEHARIDERVVLATYGAGALWRPQFRTGDALLFSGATVHRTSYAGPTMMRGRMSVELRAVAS